MAEKDVVITYETLFELLRIEKGREDLQKLQPSFFEDVLSYVNDKRVVFEAAQSQLTFFASDEKDKTKLEMDNIKRLLRELYDRREKKLVMSAINKAKTGAILVNAANMLQSERLLFDSLSMVLTEFRKNILYKLASGELPQVSMLQGSLGSMLSFAQTTSDTATETRLQEILDAPPISDDDGVSGLHFRSSDEPKDLKTTPNSSEPSASAKKIRFLIPIGEIVGPDLQIYGPYEPGMITSLPDELARVLVDKQQAEEIVM